MTQHRHIGLERQDGLDIGRDPRTLSIADLERLGHARVSPLRALRLKCLDCCNGSAQEVRLCTAVDCPSWQFRMGKNPWRAPLSAEARARTAEQMRRNRTSGSSSSEKTQGQIDASRSDEGGVRQHPPGSSFESFHGEKPGGVS